MKRIIRKQRVTAKQAKENQEVRRQIAAELPDLIARHLGRKTGSARSKSKG